MLPRFEAVPDQRLNPSSGANEQVPYAFDRETVELLNRVIGFYGWLPARALVELTHATDGPWHKVWHHGGKINPGMKNNDRDIERFYARPSRGETVQDRKSVV